jgi:hypothetical protein
MSREEIQQALTRINQAISQLNSQLHPPPDDPNERQQLEAELQAAEQARSALEQALNNLPEAAVAPLGVAEEVRRETRKRHSRAESDAAIRFSRAARMRAESVLAAVEPVTDPEIHGGVTKPKKPKP